jgi:RNA polymerase sigma factor (TIGR02999 family)
MSEVTEAISRLRSGESDAVKQVFQASYAELKRIAHARIYASNVSDRFATDSLLHESYMRLSSLKSVDVPDRKRFYAYASKVMRNIVLQEIRDANALKRGGDRTQVTLATDLVDLSARSGDVEAIDDALRELEQLHPDWAALVEMRFFGGMTEQEIAETLDVSERTVRREWQKARAALLVLLEN